MEQNSLAFIQLIHQEMLDVLLDIWSLDVLSASHLMYEKVFWN